MPIFWQDLPNINSAKEFNILNYKKYLDEKGDAWSDWRSKEAELHDQKTVVAVDIENTDRRLIKYVEKRDLPLSPEPYAVVSSDHTDKYVIQLHNASNLHYDLRLEDKGVLLSWAIPKGMPFQKGQKRLAIRTEDHPIKYLFFEGIIPSGQYGAGEMWIFNNGKITWISKSETSYKFTLSEYGGKVIYSLYKTNKADQWLIEANIDVDHIDIDSRPISPMLAESSRDIPNGDEYQYEVKWDGIRVFIYVNNGKITIVSRNGNELTDQFPELQLTDAFDIEQAVIDAEIVVLDEQGRPQFHEVISRMHTAGEQSIQILSQSKPVICYVFDLMCIDGRDIIQTPLCKRRTWLKTILNAKQASYRYSESFVDGKALFKAIELKGMEGIMAKDQNSKYQHGTRSKAWLKIKCRKMDQCLIIGYTEGKGDRSSLFGALHLAKEMDGAFVYMGKVGTGFDFFKLKEIQNILSEINMIEKPEGFKVEEESRSIWIEPKLSCSIQYASMSANDTYREPVFVNLIHQ
jgi:DNA ligase D-like protein (predicted ligase)/DNA ligase D-like protein (predicted 3'-phosphoesterase)